MERARQVQGLAGRRVRRARPSEPRAGTVTPLSVRTLTGGDVGIGRDVRPSYVQVGAGARMYGFTTRGGRALPSIRTLDNMDTHVSLETTPRSGSCVIGRDWLNGWSACSRYDDPGRRGQRPLAVPMPLTRGCGPFRLEQ